MIHHYYDMKNLADQEEISYYAVNDDKFKIEEDHYKNNKELIVTTEYRMYIDAFNNYDNIPPCEHFKEKKKALQTREEENNRDYNMLKKIYKEENNNEQQCKCTSKRHSTNNGMTKYYGQVRDDEELVMNSSKSILKHAMLFKHCEKKNQQTT